MKMNNKIREILGNDVTIAILLSAAIVVFIGIFGGRQ